MKNFKNLQWIKFNKDILSLDFDKPYYGIFHNSDSDYIYDCFFIKNYIYVGIVLQALYPNLKNVYNNKQKILEYSSIFYEQLVYYCTMSDKQIKILDFKYREVIKDSERYYNLLDSKTDYPLVLRLKYIL